MKALDYLLMYGLIYIALRPGRSISGPIRTKTRFMPVYINGKPNPGLIRASSKKPGVYLIKVGGILKYIGYSSTNVYKTILRHFQAWDDPYQVRVTYPKSSNVTARVVYTNTGQQAAKLERALILKLNPPDNPNKYKTYQLELTDQTVWENYQNQSTDAPF